MFSLEPAGTLQFHTAADLDAAALSAVQRRIRSRLLRYCARPAFASERLAWDGSDQPVRYRLTKPLPTGQTELALTPLELLDRLAALMPWPRRHRHHYAGVFAPHAKLRARDPPVLDAGFTCAFDQSPSWDSTSAASEPSFHFDQTLN